MSGNDAEKGEPSARTLASNRKALHDYHILSKVEAGIELRGPEVKSIREGKVSLNEAFADVESGQLFIHDLHIQPYAHSRRAEADPVRKRRLLLHREEIHRLLSQTALAGHTLIPLRIYLRRGWIKVELALARGKQVADKREALKRKTHARETARAIADHKR